MKLASLSTSQRGSSLSALTNDHSFIYYITCLSNAQHETHESPCTAPIEYYCPQATGLKNGVLPIVECLLSLSNAQHETRETPCTALVEYYYPQATGLKKGVLPIVEYQLSLEQQQTVERNSLYNEKWMFHPFAHKLLSKTIHIVFLLLDRFSSDNLLVELLIQSWRHACYISFDCLFLGCNLLRPCIALYLKFRQTQYSKHDFLVLKKKINSKFSSLLQGIQLRTLAAFLCNCVCQWKFKSQQFAFRFTSGKYGKNLEDLEGLFHE